jgi:phosphoenolpyruvate carboxykinase (ATP)
MALPPTVYATLFMKKIQTHNAKCWLVNTGWVGKPYGEGDRIKIAYSRAIVRNILNGALDKGEFVRDPLFGFEVPKNCDGVPQELLNPASASGNREEYEDRAKKLAGDFKDNFKAFESEAPKEVSAAMP